MNQNIPKDRTIYIQGFQDKNIKKEMIAEKFSQVGKVEEVIIKSGLKLGFYVIFSNEQAMKEALKNKNLFPGTSIKQYLNMAELERSANIVIEDLNPVYTEEKIREIFEKYGKILSLKVQFFPNSTQGIAYIQFDQAESARNCIQDAQTLNFKIKGYQEKLQQKNERKTLFLRNLPQSVESEELKKHFEEFGVVEQVNILNKVETKAYVKFTNNQGAQKALYSNKLFKGKEIQISWAIQNEEDIEVNLVTKNLNDNVTKEILQEEFSKIVPINSVQMNEFVTQNPQGTQIVKKIGYIFLESGENGRKLIDRAVKSPEIQKLYKSGTVVIMPSLKKKERDEFMKMKQQTKQFLAMHPQNRIVPPSFMFPQYPQYPQYPPYHPMYGPRPVHGSGYPQRKGPQTQPYNRQARQQNTGEQQFDINQLKTMKSQNKLDDIRNIIGQPLFNKIKAYLGNEVQRSDETVGSIAGMLLDFEVFEIEEMVRLLNDHSYFQDNVKDALQELQQP